MKHINLFTIKPILNTRITKIALLSIFALATLGVNEAWLRTGEGEMFAPAPTNELDALADRYPDLTHESLVFIEKLVGLSRSDQNVIMGFLREVVEGFGDVAPSTQPKLKNDYEWSAEELHAELDRQLQMEEQATGESEVS